VFEEAIAIANLMLQGGQEIAQTVRTATFVDNTWKVKAAQDMQTMLSHCISPCTAYSVACCTGMPSAVIALMVLSSSVICFGTYALHFAIGCQCVPTHL